MGCRLWVSESDTTEVQQRQRQHDREAAPSQSDGSRSPRLRSLLCPLVGEAKSSLPLSFPLLRNGL